MNDYSEILETRGDYRVSIEPMEHAEPPDWDGQGTIVQLSDRSFEHIMHAGKTGTYGLPDLGYLWERWRDMAMIERYLRIFHGVVGFDYFDTRDSKYVCIVTEADLREWGFDTVADFHESNPDHDNPASQVLVAWRAWTEGEVYGWQIERHVQRGTVTRSMAGEHLDESWDEDAWDEVESVWGYYGTEGAEEQARETFNDYLSRGECAGMKTDEIRIDDLRPADRYRDFDSDEWRTVTKIDRHGDTTLLWLKDGTETAEDFEYVVEVQLPRASGEPWCNHDPAALTEVTVFQCECGELVYPENVANPDTCQRCVDHDPRDRRDHGHIPDSLSHPERP